jgi:hypothetical protein
LDNAESYQKFAATDVKFTAADVQPPPLPEAASFDGRR